MYGIRRREKLPLDLVFDIAEGLASTRKNVGVGRFYMNCSRLCLDRALTSLVCPC